MRQVEQCVKMLNSFLKRWRCHQCGESIIFLNFDTLIINKVIYFVKFIFEMIGGENKRPNKL